MIDVPGRAAQLLSEKWGKIIKIEHIEPLTTGPLGNNVPYEWVSRYFLKDPEILGMDSVIVKVRRPAADNRSEAYRFYHERAALEFLSSLPGGLAPRLLTADNEAGILVLEDLSEGINLADLLVGDKADAAEQGLDNFAVRLAQLHSATAGKFEQYSRLRNQYAHYDPEFDKVSILGKGLRQAWANLQDLVAARTYLPEIKAATEQDFEALLNVLAEPGPYLSFSNGDTCPGNSLVTATGKGVTFVDFEQACFRHAMVDVSALRFPFPACACWSRLPLVVSQSLETIYQQELTRLGGLTLDKTSYNLGMGAACVAWAIVRSIRLAKLELFDAPHPLGFSRRGQLVDTLNTTVNSLQQLSGVTAITEWMGSFEAALRERWLYLPNSQSVYPAFQG